MYSNGWISICWNKKLHGRKCCWGKWRKIVGKNISFIRRRGKTFSYFDTNWKAKPSTNRKMVKYFFLLPKDHEKVSTVNTNHSACAAQMSLESTLCFLRLITSRQLSRAAGAMSAIYNLIFTWGCDHQKSSFKTIWIPSKRKKLTAFDLNWHH